MDAAVSTPSRPCACLGARVRQERRPVWLRFLRLGKIPARGPRLMLTVHGGSADAIPVKQVRALVSTMPSRGPPLPSQHDPHTLTVASQGAV